MKAYTIFVKVGNINKRLYDVVFMRPMTLATAKAALIEEGYSPNGLSVKATVL